MKKLSSLFIALTLLGPLVYSQPAKAMSPKTKAFMFLTLQGAGAGALLGAASIPLFDTDSKAIFQGASLGLYAGILFGGYVLWSHGARNSSNYGQQDDYYDDGNGYGSGEDDGYFDEEQTQRSSLDFYDTKKGSYSAPFYMNLVHYTF